MADDQMLERHRRQWGGFVKLMTWSTIGVIVVLVGMALFLL